MMNPRRKLNTIALIIILITFFVFITSFTVFYTEENFSSACGCKLPIWVIIISISSFGLFIGSLIYYLLNRDIHYERKNTKNIQEALFSLLEDEEKDIMKLIIKNSGKIYQSKIAKELNLDKVKVSRIISSLEKKNVLEREKIGMTNMISLKEDFKNILE